jgi:hypothetical protein
MTRKARRSEILHTFPLSCGILTPSRLCSHGSVTPADIFPTNRVVCAGTPPAEDGVGPTGIVPIEGDDEFIILPPIKGGGLPTMAPGGGGPPIIIELGPGTYPIGGGGPPIPAPSPGLGRALSGAIFGLLAFCHPPLYILSLAGCTAGKPSWIEVKV